MILFYIMLLPPCLRNCVIVSSSVFSAREVIFLQREILWKQLERCLQYRERAVRKTRNQGKKNVELLFEEKNPWKEAMHKILRWRVYLIKKKGVKKKSITAFEEPKIYKVVARQRGNTVVRNVSYVIRVSFLRLVKLLSASLWSY